MEKELNQIEGCCDNLLNIKEMKPLVKPKLMNNYNFRSILIFLFRNRINYGPESNQSLDITLAKPKKKIKCSPLSPMVNMLKTVGPGSYAGACFTK